jgi:hypothetical protein
MRLAASAAGASRATRSSILLASSAQPASPDATLCPGVRKEFELNGAQVLLFWYRNQIYAIQARSPAEGAYSEGFIKAKFTQARGTVRVNARATRGSDIRWYRHARATQRLATSVFVCILLPVRAPAGLLHRVPLHGIPVFAQGWLDHCLVP